MGSGTGGGLFKRGGGGMRSPNWTRGPAGSKWRPERVGSAVSPGLRGDRSGPRNPRKARD